MMTASTLLSLGALRAQDADAVGETDSSQMDSGSDSNLLPAVPPAPDIAPPTTPDEAQALDQTLYGEGDAMNAAPAEPDAQSRSWKVNLHASVDSRYDSNIFITDTHPVADVLTDLIAGAGLTLGDYTARQNNYVISDYTGTEELFGHNSNQDAYEQNATLQAQLLFGHITFHADFEFQDLADEDIDIGARARREFYIGHASARYDISDKTYLEATGGVTIANYDQFLDSNTEQAGLSFNYLPDPSVTVGIGAYAGVLNVQDSGSQTFEQLLSSLQVNFTGKFTLDASAGIEDRKTPSDTGLLNPVLEIAGDYKPSDGLDLTLTAFRRVENSAFYEGSDFITTGASASVRYDLSTRFTLSLQGGYGNCDYRGIASGGNGTRSDDYLFVRPSFRYVPSPYWNLELYYFYRDNDSNVETSSFTDTQVGASVNVTY